jgi:hypothetical protein
MCVSQVGTGTLAAAVLGVGTGATTHAPKTAGAAASQIGRELAKTGASLTVELVVLATIMLIAGMLLISLTRRHAPTRRVAPGADPPLLV